MGLLSGMTQGVIPSMVHRGVLGVSIGVNDQVPPPVTPPLFVWKYGVDSVMATFHPVNLLITYDLIPLWFLTHALI